MILLVGVIMVGFSVLIWAQANSSSYMTGYTSTVNSDIDTLGESLSFEFTFYNLTSSNLRVYVLNSGQVDSVNFTGAYVSNSSGWIRSFNSSQFQLRFFNGSSMTVLNSGQEGYIDISSLTVQQNNVYSIKLISRRGSSFANSFVP